MDVGTIKDGGHYSQAGNPYNARCHAGLHMNFPLERWGVLPHHGSCSTLPHVVYDPRHHQEEVFGDGGYFYGDDPRANFDPMYFPAWASYG